VLLGIGRDRAAVLEAVGAIVGISPIHLQLVAI